MSVQFQTIWENYPNTDQPCVETRTHRPAFENQCAIRVSYALRQSGISFANFRGSRCPPSTSTSGLPTVAQQLADWLNTRPFSECPRSESYPGDRVFDAIEDRTGIVFFANYWQRHGESGNARTGDHIDLWNGSRLTTTFSWFRVHMGISWDGLFSDFRLAPRTVFWNIP